MQYHSFKDLFFNSKKPIFQINNFNQKECCLDNYCFDCGLKNPELISINNGIFICNKCGLNHMLFPGGTSILIKNDIKSLSEREMKYLQYGGNRKLYEFILNQCPSLFNLPRKFLYMSPLVNFYQKHLQELVYDNTIDINPKNKIPCLQINPNYSSKEIYNAIKMKFLFDPNYDRHNTCNFDNSDIINEGNEYKNNALACKKFCKKGINKSEDENYYNRIFTQKTNNTNANTLSSNTLTYISEKANENNLNVNDNKKVVNQINKFLKKNNIVYNKPKLQNSFKTFKNEKNINNNNNLIIKSYRYNNSASNYKNIINNNYHGINYNYNFNYNAGIENAIETPSKSQNDSTFIVRNNKIFHNTEQKYIFDNELDNELFFRNINSSIFRTPYNNDSYYSHRKNNSLNTSGDKHNTDFNGRKIKEIIINKNIKKVNIDSDDLIKNLSLTHFKAKSNLQQDNQIQENLNINNKKEITQNNYYKSKNYIQQQLDLNENNNINENKNNNNNNDNHTDFKIKLHKNKININTNKNFKKILNNIDNSMDDIENKSISKEPSKDNVNIHNTSINFYINKSKLDVKALKKLYFQSKMSNFYFKDDEKNIKSKEIKKIHKEKKIISNHEDKENEIIKDNVSHFQIVPIIKKKKITYENDNDKNSIDYNMENNNDQKNSLNKKLHRRNISGENIMNKYENYFSKSVEVKNGETFKYSIRNKYKRERSLDKSL